MAYLRSLLILSRQQAYCLGHLISAFFVICQAGAQTQGNIGVRPPDNPNQQWITNPAVPGAWDMAVYVPLLKDKKVGLVVNQTSLVGETHLVDTLLSLGIEVKAIFSPEHGFRGTADAGTHIQDSLIASSGIQIISLYGEKKKPDTTDLKGLDVLVYDIQDVGVRFYTYINTMFYIMEAAGENQIPVIVLDRPNPNGYYIDGPVLDTARFKSFVGMLPIPVVYGMTPGELARMINGEKWIKKACTLTVIPCQQYDHTMTYELPVKPSPNLPNLRSVLLYPGICFFEGTFLSLGRGTTTPFQVVGHPSYPDHSFSFTPTPMPGAINPPLKDKLCYGVDLTKTDIDSLLKQRKMDLSILLMFHSKMDRSNFFNTYWFDKLAGNSSFRQAIEAGWGEAKIRESWKAGLMKFNERRKMYLLYKDF